RPLFSVAHRGEVKTIAFSRDGRLMATGSSDLTIRLWDASTGEARGLPLVQPTLKTVWGVAFSPDGKTLAAGTADAHARLWQLGPPKVLLTLTHHGGENVWCVAFSPDGRLLLTGCGDGIARLWDAATGEPRGELKHGRDNLYAVAFSPDGK